ncbi:hypothetical protein QVD99_007995 [Batrachochytrium dendrobatidis]|nr:hypothetical protein O5D80_004851 [Batrachochytrium dendrobatidis]KAK5665146.1 hypothetical protein QVD99_007995 [Batrachochytrium dendrobatidis]
MASSKHLTDPKKPLNQSSIGYRPTVFTYLATTSHRSLTSFEQKLHLEKYFAVRVLPPQGVFSDYMTGQTYQQILRIKNLSKMSKRVSILPTKSVFFKLDKKDMWDNVLISPGMEKEMTIVFNATPSSIASANTDQSKATHTDCFIVQVQGSSDITVPLVAYPCVPILEFESAINFGTLLRCSDNDYPSVSAEPNPKNIQDLPCKVKQNDSIVHEHDLVKNSDFDYRSVGKSLNWAVKYVTICNVGKIAASFECTWDLSLPIKVTPTKATLDPFDTKLSGNSCKLKIEFLPTISGPFNAKIYIDPSGMTSALKTKNPISNDTRLSVNVSANVIDHKLCFRNARNGYQMDWKDFNFGTVYYGDAIRYPVYIENLWFESVAWEISRLNQDDPAISNINSMIKTRQPVSLSEENAENQKAISCVPCSGNLLPGQSTLVHFKFEPHQLLLKYGFKTNRAAIPASNYQTPMELRVLNGGGGLGEKAMQVDFVGRACELLATLSLNSLIFPDTQVGSTVTRTIELNNSSNHLGFHFYFSKYAQFQISPASGKLLPLQKIAIHVSFRPHQLGLFNIAAACHIKACTNNSNHISAFHGIESGKMAFDDKILTILSVSLCATGIPVECSQLNLVQSTHSLEHLSTDKSKIVIQEVGLNEVTSNILQNGTCSKSRLDIALPSNHSKKTCASLDSIEPPKVNRDWIKRAEHYCIYTDYIRSCRSKRMTSKQDPRLAQTKKIYNLNSHLCHQAISDVDPENGLLPPQLKGKLDCLGISECTKSRILASNDLFWK